MNGYSRWVVATVVVTAGVSAGLIGHHWDGRTPAAPATIPGFRFEPPEHIASPVLASEVADGTSYVESTFQLRNNTDQPQTIRYVGADCGCAGVKYADTSEPASPTSRWVLDPGATRPVAMRIAVRPKTMASSATARFEGETANGRVSTASCKLAVSVVDDLTMSPATYVQNLDSPAGQAEATIRVTTATRTAAVAAPVVDQLPVGVTCLEVAPAEPGSVGRDGLHRDNWVVRLAIRWDNDTPGDGAAQVARVLIPRTDARPAEAGLPIILRRTTGLEVASFVHFGTVGLGTSGARRLVVRARDGRPFRITEAVVPRWLTARYEPGEGDTSWRVELRASPDRAGGYEDAIRLLTDNRVSPTLVVNVVVVVEAPAVGGDPPGPK